MRRASGTSAPGRAVLLAVVALCFTVPMRVSAQGTPGRVAPTVHLGDLYSQVEQANPRTAVAKSLVAAARARVPGATRPPDPQVQLGFMNYMVPSLAPMATLGMRQVQVMQMLPLGGKLALSGRVAES